MSMLDVFYPCSEAAEWYYKISCAESGRLYYGYICLDVVDRTERKHGRVIRANGF